MWNNHYFKRHKELRIGVDIMKCGRCFVFILLIIIYASRRKIRFFQTHLSNGFVTSVSWTKRTRGNIWNAYLSISVNYLIYFSQLLCDTNWPSSFFFPSFHNLLRNALDWFSFRVAFCILASFASKRRTLWRLPVSYPLASQWFTVAGKWLLSFVSAICTNDSQFYCC